MLHVDSSFTYLYHYLVYVLSLLCIPRYPTLPYFIKELESRYTKYLQFQDQLDCIIVSFQSFEELKHLNFSGKCDNFCHKKVELTNSPS
jgi:hypothetical protein